MESFAKRLILISALGLVSVIAVPVFTTGQSYQPPRTQFEYDVRELQKQVGKLDEVPARLAIMGAKMDALQIGQQKQEEWRDKEILGLLALAGSAILLMVERMLGAFGVTFRDKR